MRLKQCIFALMAMLLCAFSANAQGGSVAKIGDTEYTTFAEALTAASAISGDVTIEVYDKVTLNTAFSGSYSSINFVGKDTDAEIYLDVQGYITATGKNVSFTDLTLSKSAGVYITNAGFMNVAFGIYDVVEVAYTNCKFANGAYASSGNVTFNGCTFYRSHDKYGLWAYGNVDVAVEGCTFADYRGIKMYAEGAAKTVDLTVKNTNFSAVTDKPAIVLTYGESVVLEGNTYSSTGTFELDKDGAPNGTAVTSDVAPTCKNDYGTCGVLVDGKIYTTVAQAVEVATEGSNVTLLYSTTETAEFAEGVNLTLASGVAADNVTVATSGVAKIGDTTYATLAEAAAAAKAGDEIVLLGDVAEDATLPAGVKFNGNDKAVGNLTAGGEITFTGVTKATSFGVQYTNTTVNIVPGASLEITGSGRMVIGHGCTFNITGNIEDAKTAEVAALTPSLVMPGASFTGAGVTFNVTDAYIKTTASYCSSSKTASGTFDFNIENSIWEQFDKLAFESQSVNATVYFDLVNSVLNTTSHLVFGVSRGEVVIDNSNVNVGTSRQIENQSTMTIKNGAVVNGAVATSSNAKNPGTLIVENATYAVTGEFSGSDLGTGTLIVKKGATVSAGSITKANIQIDATGMAAGDEVNLTANLSNLAGSLTVINNDNLDASIVDGKIVLAVKPVAKIGDVEYTSLEAALEAVQAGETVTLLADINLSEILVLDKAITLDLNGKKVTSTAKKAFEVHADATIKNGAIEAAQRCVDTRTAVELTLTDVELVATSITYGNPQPLTIGGSDNGTQVTMENVEINAGTAGYGIITFVKTELTATNSTIGGYSALYVKPGSDNSEFNFVNSDLSGGNIGNDVEGNSFSTIAVRANNVAVNVDAESTVTANGDHYFAISFIGTSENTTTGSSVTVAGEITGNILDTPNGNTVKVKAEYADELAAAGYDALPDLNGNYVVGVKPTATVNNLGMITVAAGEYSIYNGNSFDQNTEDDGDMPLSFVMQFLANQTAADMATSPYADWYGDFVITFTGIENGSFTADGCYLAGHYGSFGWVKVPVDGMTIEEGARYPVMLGVGLGQKYDYICSSVQDFKCALYLTPEILEANPNIEVKLELAVVDNSKGGEAAKSALINNENVYSVTEYTYKAEDFVADVELPEVEITDIKGSLTDSDPDLTFALNFAIKDVENLTDEYLEKLFAQYGDWYTDYVLTISGLTDENVTFNANGNADGYLAGQYDAWSENWVSVPFEDVTLKNDSSIYIMEYAAKLMGKQGLRFTLAEVAEIVQNFDCGVYFTPEFLAANPNMKVDLQLKVFTEDAEGNKVNNIDVATNNFEVKDYVAIVHATGKQTTYCTTLADAVAAATEGTTITMLRDVELAEDVTIPAGKEVVLDLNGKTVSQSKECTDSYAMITNNGSLTITGNGKLSFTDTSAGDPSFGWGSYTINNRGTLVVENGTIEHLGTQAFATHMICAIFQYSGSTTINGGIISTPNYRSARLWKGDMTINGGEFDGQLWVQAVDNSAKLTINGGTFAPNGRDASSVFVGNVDGQDRLYNVEFAVTDGTFTTKIGCSNAAEIAGDGIKGGKFTESAMNNTNSALLAEGFVFADEVVDGYYGIVADPNYIAEFIIDDAARLDYDNDTDKTVGTLTYKRTLAEGAWNPLYLPFQVDVAQLADNYDIAYYNQMLSSDSNNDGAFDSYIMEVAYITSGTLNANYPYFIRPKTSDDCYLEYVANDVTLFAAKDTVIVTSSVANIFKLHGTHKTVSAADLAGCYTIKASGWVQTTIDLRPHRLYLEILENDNSPFISAAAKSIRIVVRGEDDEDGTTGIDGIYGDENGETVIFDLYGRRVLEPEKGNIYIINGKKVLVK